MEAEGCYLVCLCCCVLSVLQIILSVAEHHSNLVPWQMVAQKTGAVLKHVRLTPDTQELDMQVCAYGLGACQAGVASGTAACSAAAAYVCRWRWYLVGGRH